ncbi:adenosine kinase-like [Cylas formicarius]|uniref:adenosine kinase-like n=1 Tax=Cylas formicarius TaxID=197179 RepID=UPI002958A692|nr:adenosine kinase-like [Cylas formicarius]
MTTTILGFGNPLLDISVFLNDDYLLKKYSLKKDDQKEICKSDMISLYKDIQGLKQHLSSGGCCSNTFRVLQWVLKKKANLFLYGTVGKDEEANILRDSLKLDGVNSRFNEHETMPTGKIIALISGPYRSLVAYIGAAEFFPKNILCSDKDFINLFKSSELIFMEAFFLTNRADVAKYVADLCSINKKILAFNLCGEYIFNIVPKEILYLVRHSDIIFGNQHEFEALMKLLNYASISNMISELLKVTEDKFQYKRIFIITNGPNPVTCYYSNGECFKMMPSHLSDKNIVDTTGAGDAFIGGFLAGMLLSKEIKECVKIGIYASENIIKEIGCTLPKHEAKIP